MYVAYGKWGSMEFKLHQAPIKLLPLSCLILLFGFLTMTHLGKEYKLLASADILYVFEKDKLIKLNDYYYMN